MPTEYSRRKEKIRHIPETPGVYFMKDRLGSILYIGKAKNLKRRVSSYFQKSKHSHAQQPKVAAMIDLIADIDYIQVKTEAEAALLEGKLIKEWKPKYNTDFIDDKRFLLIRVDVNAPMPKFRLTRLRTDPNSRYFGPFSNSTAVRKTLHQLRKQTGILLGDATPKKLENHSWQLYDDIRAEIYGHDNIISESSYRERVEKACSVLEGKTRDLLTQLRDDMQQAAQNQLFERAAMLRDQIQSIERTTAPDRRFERGILRTVQDPETAMQALQKAIQLPVLPSNIECFDISHISGSFTVASMVHFTDGKPDKKNYRRFRIKSFTGNDDFQSMREVVGRRYSRLHEENKPMPELIVIDGGIGQVRSALESFHYLNIHPPTLIGLAKREETIVFPDERQELKLSLDHPGLQLLQRIRDEAHRFANTYNADLRSKKIKESILDEFPNLGETKKKALLEHFKSIRRLKQATAEEIQSVEGIGPTIAQRLAEFLGKRDK